MVVVVDLQFVVCHSDMFKVIVALSLEFVTTNLAYSGVNLPQSVKIIRLPMKQLNIYEAFKLQKITINTKGPIVRAIDRDKLETGNNILQEQFWEIQVILPAARNQLHCPKSIQMITKTTMVPKQPPPNLEAPYPAISPLNILFIDLYGLLMNDLTNL